MFRLDDRTTKLTPLFLNESARSIAVSLLSFFSVIYIYKKILEISGDQTLAFLFTFSFYAILYLFKIVGTFAAENSALKIGLKAQVLAGNFLTMGTLLAFFFSEKNLVFLILAAALWGLAIGFFWFGHYGLLAKTGHVGEFGEAVGWAGVINSFFVVTTPFLGGFLVSTFSYQALFLVSLVILFFGLLPLRGLRDQEIHRDTSFSEVLSLFSSHKRMALSYFAIGAVGAIYSLSLILYIFLFLEKEFDFGKFFSASLVLVALVNFVVGKWTDKRGKRGLVYYGAFLASLTWVGRVFAGRIFSLLIFDVIDRIAGGMVGIPLLVLSFEKALDGGSTGRALIFREMALSLGSLFTTLLLMLIVFLGFPLSFSFWLAAGFGLAPLLIIKHGLVSSRKK